MQACFICGSKSSTHVSSVDRRGEALETRVCDGCGLVFNSPVPTDEELVKFYSIDYRRDYKGTPLPRVRQVIRNLQRYSRHIANNWALIGPAKRVLDIGAGSGEFLFLMKALGKVGRGLEPNLDYSSYDREHLGLDVQTGDIYFEEFAKGSFDLIRLSHVMEHLNDPVRALSRMREWLSPTGLLYIETPDIEYDAANKVKGTLYHYGHIWNFNGVTQRAVAALAGLEEAPGAVSDGENTCVFYRAAAMPAATTENPANATTVTRAVQAHYTDRRPLGRKLDKGLRQVGRRIAEFREAKTLKTQRAAADAYAARLKAKLGV